MQTRFLTTKAQLTVYSKKKMILLPLLYTLIHNGSLTFAPFAVASLPSSLHGLHFDKGHLNR